jgi:hypothetical protein
VSEAEQQPLVNWTMLLNEIGLAIVLIVLAALLIWRLVDLFKRRGRWKDEYDGSRMDNVDAGALTAPPLGDDSDDGEV